MELHKGSKKNNRKGNWYARKTESKINPSKLFPPISLTPPKSYIPQIPYQNIEYKRNILLSVWIIQIVGMLYNREENASNKNNA